MKKDFYNSLKSFDFSGGLELVHISEYDLTNEKNIQLLDNDSIDANTCVKDLGLSYTVDAKHYSTCIKGDHTNNMVNVVWKFWIEKDE